MRLGAAGLGVGTLAAYAGPGDEYRFDEINPEVLRLARQYCTYLADCRGTCEVVPGDGRVSLEREAPPNFDVLVVDAFSSAAIPLRLLTREAFALSRCHLAPGGVLAVHITNRHLHLVPVVEGLSRHFGYRNLRITTQEHDDRLVFDADWVLTDRCPNSNRHSFALLGGNPGPANSLDPREERTGMTSRDQGHSILRCFTRCRGE